MSQLSQLEQKVLGILRRNSRTPVSAMAQELGVTRTTISRTIARLENSGVVVAYTVRTQDDDAPAAVRAIACVELENTTTKQAIAELRGIPEIQTISTTNGAWDLVLELECEDLAHFDEALRAIRQTRGIINSQTNILLSSIRV